MGKWKGRWLVFVLVLVVVGGGGYAYYDNVYLAGQEESNEPPLQTATVRQGDLAISASAVGTTMAASEVNLSFGTSGVVAEMLVRVGDEVQAGDVLARLDEGTARQAIVNAELAVAQALLPLDEVALARSLALADLDVAQAQLNLDVAQGALDELLNWVPDADGVALAEANLAGAQAQFVSAAGNEAASSYQLQNSQIGLEQAQRNLATAQENYDNAFDVARDWEPNIEGVRDGAEASLQRAQDDLAVAEANFNAAQANLSYSGSASAQTGILSAEQALAGALTPPTEAEIEAAEVLVAQMVIALQRVGLNREGVLDVAQAELGLRQAELSLAVAQDGLADLVLVAPVGGVVTAVLAEGGEVVGTGAVVTLVNLAEPLLEVFLEETDLDKVGLDFEAEVVFDALPDDVFSGRVIQVDPQLVTVSGVSTVRAVVQLTDYDKVQVLPIGLTASVDVVAGRVTNVMLVPVEALRELSPGEFSVFVMEGDEPRLRFVEVGLADFTFAEVVSGLEAGEVVTTGIVDTE